MPTLAVIGAGPKGIAIAAKARALTAAGLPAPRVILIDPGPVTGNWTGHQGYTSGLLPLGTPPEKDVGYPYAGSWGPRSAAVTAAMAEYSFQRHVIADPRPRPAASASAGPRRAELLAGRVRVQRPHGDEHLSHRQRRNGGRGRSQPAGQGTPAVGYRRSDQPRSPVLAGREPR